MENSVIFSTFQTYKNSYVYDRHTNSIVTVNEDEYDELKCIERGEISPQQSSVISKYQEQGLFYPNVVQAILHPQTDILKLSAEKRLKQLILQVTQQCNLKCEYCAYYGIYDGNRTHASKRMSFEIAKKAINFFFDHILETSEVAIGFYGGDPLLEFDLIKKCVNYINEKK